MRPRSRTTLLALAFAAVTPLLLATGCSSISVRSERFLGAPQLPPTDPAQVELLRRVPKRDKVEKLGEVILSPSGDPSVEEMEQAIRVEAAKLGADAAAIVYDRTRRVGSIVSGPWWARTSQPVYGRKIVAVALKYRD